MGTDALVHLHGQPVWLCAAEGLPLADEQAALDVIGAALGTDASWVAVPVDRLTDDFFVLRSGLAGAIVQKFANYRLRFVVIGDVSAQVAASTALRDFVNEANRGRRLWLLPSLDDFAARLNPMNPA